MSQPGRKAHPVVCYDSHKAELSARQGCLAPLNGNCLAKFLLVPRLYRTVTSTLQYSSQAMMKIADYACLAVGDADTDSTRWAMTCEVKCAALISDNYSKFFPTV